MLRSTFPEQVSSEPPLPPGDQICVSWNNMQQQHSTTFHNYCCRYFAIHRRDRSMAMMAAPMSLEADQGTADAVEGGQLLHVDSAFHIQGVLICVDTEN